MVAPFQLNRNVIESHWQKRRRMEIRLPHQFQALFLAAHRLEMIVFHRLVMCPGIGQGGVDTLLTEKTPGST